MRVRHFRRTTFVSIFCGSILLGLVAGYFLRSPAFVLLIPGFILVLAVPRRTVFSIIGCVVCGFCMGWWRGSLANIQLNKYRPYYKKSVHLIVRSSEDAVYGEKSQLEFGADHVMIYTGSGYASLPGKINVKGLGEKAIYRYDSVEVIGSLYPSKGVSRQANVSFAGLHVIVLAKSPFENFRRRYNAGMYSALPEPLSSFALGLLVGQRNTLPKNLTEQLQHVGLSHVVAVSGYNLTIMVQFMQNYFQKRSKFQTFVLSLMLIFGFLFVTGFSPSIIRAAWVSCLSLATWYYGRRFKPLPLLLITASVTAMGNPIYVWGDLSWYLSFLAFYGVLIMSPLVTKLVYKEHAPPAVIGLVIESVSAQIITVPLTLFIFGQLSVYGILANVVIVPLVPLAMLLAFSAGLSGVVIPNLIGWFALPSRYLLTFMLDVVNLFNKIPGMFREVRIDLFTMTALYTVVIISCILMHWRVSRRKVANRLEYEHVWTQQMVNNQKSQGNN